MYGKYVQSSHGFEGKKKEEELFDLSGPAAWIKAWINLINSRSNLPARTQWKQKSPKYGSMNIKKYSHTDVSKNSGFYPQIIQFNRIFHCKPSILGYPYFWKHPYQVNHKLNKDNSGHILSFQKKSGVTALPEEKIWNLANKHCWWEKPCTTWDIKFPVNDGINYLSTGAEFLPSTVCPPQSVPPETLRMSMCFQSCSWLLRCTWIAQYNPHKTEWQ